jgi:hypothetical protein
MTSKPGDQKAGDVTEANETANRQFNGDKAPKGGKAKDVEEANEKANAEFNADNDKPVIGGDIGLRGSPD